MARTIFACQKWTRRTPTTCLPVVNAGTGLDGRRWRRPSLRSWQLVVVAATVLRPDTTPVSSASNSQQIVRFEGTVEGDLAVAYTPGQAGAVFWGSGMATPDDGQVYEIWMIADGTPVSGGCVVPHDGTVAVAVQADVGTSESMAVTLEDPDCPAAPTTPPVFQAELPTVA